MRQDSLLYSHDPALYHDETTGYYYLYCTGAKIYRSKDMLSWSKLKHPATHVPDKAKEWTGSDAIWAPDLYKEGDEYRLYCSNSSWGVQQSCIFLAVSDTPEGPFIPRDVVLKSSDKLKVNAIDAGLITDHKTGILYMVYGSFWGGIHLIELDRTTGLAKTEGIGICLAKRPLWTDGAIEGPYIVYNPETDYYYLFVSYGSLKSDYNIRVGRSKNVTGPYVDPQGKNMTDLEDCDLTVGYMVVCGYEFTSGAFMGPGHNSVLKDFDGRWYLASHIRPRNFFGDEPSTTHIRSMLWTKDGWPVISPLPFNQEVNLTKNMLVSKYFTSSKEDIATEERHLAKLVSGTYERIHLAPTIPQGIQSYVKMILKEDGTGMLADSIHLTWNIEEETQGYCLKINYCTHQEELYILVNPDKSNPTVSLTGTDEKHICVWAIKHS